MGIFACSSATYLVAYLTYTLISNRPRASGKPRMSGQPKQPRAVLCPFLPYSLAGKDHETRERLNYPAFVRRATVFQDFGTRLVSDYFRLFGVLGRNIKVAQTLRCETLYEATWRSPVELETEYSFYSIERRMRAEN